MSACKDELLKALGILNDFRQANHITRLEFYAKPPDWWPEQDIRQRVAEKVKPVIDTVTKMQKPPRYSMPPKMSDGYTGFSYEQKAVVEKLADELVDEYLGRFLTCACSKAAESGGA